MLEPAQRLSADDTNLGELVDAFVAQSLASLLTAERAILRPNGGATGLPLDVDAVHRFRVAARRLRSTLGTYRGCWPRETRRMLRDELRAIGRAAGAVRDADVLAERLRTHAARLDDVDRPALERLLELLHAERAAAHAALQGALTTPHHAAFRAAFGALAFGAFGAGEPADAPDPRARRATTDASPGHPAFVPVDAGRDVVRAQRRRERPARRAKKRVRASWRELRRAVRTMLRAIDASASDALDTPADETLHALRILAKRCRYAAESVAPIVGPRALRFAHALADVQSVLGEHQDTVSAEAWLRRTVESAGEPAGAATTGLVLLTGELIGLERVERTRCRAAFDAAWEHASRAGKKAERRWL